MIIGLLVGQTDWNRLAPTNSVTLVRDTNVRDAVSVSQVDASQSVSSATHSPRASIDPALVASFDSQLAEIELFDDERSRARADDAVVPSLPKEESPFTVKAEVPAKPMLASLVSAPLTNKPPKIAAPAIVSFAELESRSTLLPSQCQDGTCQENLESLGTELRWADTPSDAYRMADEQDKLVFLIHVSGNFEIPGFT